MAEDVLADWKKGRFAVVDARGWDMGLSWVIILSDTKYWIDQWLNLESWCQMHGCTLSGLTVEVPDEKILTLFQLRWL